MSNLKLGRFVFERIGGLTLLALAIAAAPTLTHAASPAQAGALQPAQSTNNGVLDPCQIKLDEIWIRATVPGQTGTGVFMKITAAQDCQLVAVKTPITEIAQVHRTVMNGSVAQMREASEGIALPAGQTVTLMPGGWHLMLMDLKQTIDVGTVTPLTLILKNTKTGQQGQLAIEARARPLGAKQAHPDKS
jgi:copper(I)-binding protein